MLNLYPRLQLQQASAAADDGGDENLEAVDGGGYNPFYGIAVVCVSIFLFCILAASVDVWKALAFAVLAAVLLGVAGCFAPRGWFRPSGPAGATAELVVTVRTATGAGAGLARPGRAVVLEDAPPAFAFVCSCQQLEGGGGGADRQAAAAAAAGAASCVVCSVCLEDVRGGEMVRQVPACRHIFHVGCIDMWLLSHRTCPMCRCVVVAPPPPKVTQEDASAAEASPEPSADDDELPPV